MYADNRSHVDDRAAALTEHVGQNGVDEVERALEVDCNHGVPLLFGHSHHQAVFSDACVVDKDVDTAEVFNNFSNDFFGLVEICSI